MRKAFAWLGCLAPMVLMGCATSATSTGARPKTVVGGCAGTVCTVVFNEAASTCSVDPPSLAIHSDYTVTFLTQVSGQTAAVVVSPKAANGINFQNGPPGRIDRGRQHDSGRATGPDGAEYTYAARFVNGSNGNVCRPIDPVICIKPGGDFTDTCE